MGSRERGTQRGYGSLSGFIFFASPLSGKHTMIRLSMVNPVSSLALGHELIPPKE
jgi:hypothetical protein